MFPTGDGGVCLSTYSEFNRGQGGLMGGGGAASLAGIFSSLNADGNTMEVNLWDGNGWSANTTTIFKPPIFQAQAWNGETIVRSDGTSVTYDVIGLNMAYQRRATWTVDAVDYSEVQEITGPYEVGKILYIKIDCFGNMVDDNNGGRHWGVNEDYS